MNNQTEFIADCLRRFQQQFKRMADALAKKNLTDKGPNTLLLTFKKMSRLHRKILDTADCYNAVSPAELAATWREFVETGLAVCDGQEKLISAKLESRKLSVSQRCALITMFARVLKLSRGFEGYKDEAMQLAKSA
jgi:hypothetical protein